MFSDGLNRLRAAVIRSRIRASMRASETYVSHSCLVTMRQLAARKKPLPEHLDLVAKMLQKKQSIGALTQEDLHILTKAKMQRPVKVANGD